MIEANVPWRKSAADNPAESIPLKTLFPAIGDNSAFCLAPAHARYYPALLRWFAAARPP